MPKSAACTFCSRACTFAAGLVCTISYDIILIIFIINNSCTILAMSSLPLCRAKVLRKRSHIPDYREKKESDIPAPYRKKIHHKIKDNLFPIEVVEEDTDSARYKVHYIGYSSAYDEWRERDAIVDIEDPHPQDPNPEDPNPENLVFYDIGRFSLYRELATRVKSALNSSRKASPIVRIDLPFDKIEFDGGLRVYGVKKCFIRGAQHYGISKFQDLNQLLGVDWHCRGININGDFCYVILNTVEFFLYHRRSLKEFVPSADGGVKEICRHTGDMLVFSFVKGDGTPAQFGKDRTIFVN